MKTNSMLLFTVAFFNLFSQQGNGDSLNHTPATSPYQLGINGHLGATYQNEVIGGQVTFGTPRTKIGVGLGYFQNEEKSIQIGSASLLVKIPLVAIDKESDLIYKSEGHLLYNQKGFVAYQILTGIGQSLQTKWSNKSTLNSSVLFGLNFDNWRPTPLVAISTGWDFDL